MLPLSVTVLTSPLLPSSTAAVRLRQHPLLRVRARAAGAASSQSPSARSLRLLEWGKVCDAVASFAGTAHGRNATKKQLWEVEDVSYEQSQRLLQETEAAVWLLDNAGGAMDFSGLDTVAIESAIRCVSGGAVIKGLEAVAVASLIMFVESLQLDIKAAMKLDEGSHSRLTALTETILDAVISKSLVKSIQDIVDDDGSVKDTASPELRRYRERVQILESRLYQLMDKLMRNADNEASLSEVCIVNGRCCIRTTGNKSSTFDGLLLSSLIWNQGYILIKIHMCCSGAGAGSMIEPISAVPLNDELQEARALVAKAELDVLSKLTDKILLELDSIQSLLQETIKLDKEVRRRRIYGQGITEDQLASDIESMKLRVSQLEKDQPIPVDFMIAEETTVLVITGPNTGGKTISLKTVGLASLMAKIGLYILASEPVKIPWFNAVYADIGDEQSLTQSLSTFSGHLKQIGAIRAESTSESLVLLDEVSSLSTIRCILIPCNNSFENACVEFDEENLKPTFKILWGIPGRSNAINIAERLGLPSDIVESARGLLGTAGAEINALITEMERFKQDYQQHLQKAQHLLMQSKELHNTLELAQKNIVDHTSAQRKRRARVISEYAVMARSIIRKKFQQFQESAIAERVREEEKAVNNAKSERVKDPVPASTAAMAKTQNTDTNLGAAADDEEDGIPEVGDSVYVPKLKNQATVVKIDSSKNELQVQAGMMKLKLKLQDVKVQKRKVSR
nr:unnamed protein product [Digitaria exilis]